MPKGKNKIDPKDILILDEPSLDPFMEELLGCLVSLMKEQNISSLEVNNKGEVKIDKRVQLTTFVEARK